MDKTITVLVDRRIMHPLYKKFIRRSKKYAAHDEANACKSGDMVRIVECPPISKRKTWTVIERNGAVLDSASADALASVEARAHSHVAHAEARHAAAEPEAAVHPETAQAETAQDGAAQAEHEVPPAEFLPAADAPMEGEDA
jgi:small subunit ribosomal protein S17